MKDRGKWLNLKRKEHNSFELFSLLWVHIAWDFTSKKKLEKE